MNNLTSINTTHLNRSESMQNSAINQRLAKIESMMMNMNSSQNEGTSVEMNEIANLLSRERMQVAVLKPAETVEEMDELAANVFLVCISCIVAYPKYK